MSRATACRTISGSPAVKFLSAERHKKGRAPAWDVDRRPLPLCPGGMGTSPRGNPERWRSTDKLSGDRFNDSTMEWLVCRRATACHKISAGPAVKSLCGERPIDAGALKFLAAMISH